MQSRQNKFSQRSFRELLQISAELMKVRITFFVMLTTVFGYICAAGSAFATAVFAACGIFALACSASVLNHLQERQTDGLMNRTKDRPLPANRISVRYAIGLAVGLLLIGSAILIACTNMVTYALGISALIWYNIIYTPLKKKHFIAVIPGSVIGALPPIAGWAAAGRNILEPQILLIGLFFFIWQIPHFWLLLLLYRGDYENAGFPTLFKYLNQAQVARMTFVWTAGTGFIGILFPVFSIIKPVFAIILIGGAFLLLVFKSASLLRDELTRQQFRAVFLGINLYVLFVVIVASLDKLLLNL